MPHSSFIYTWLVVSTPLKNISQMGLLFPIYGKIKAMFQTTNQTQDIHSIQPWVPTSARISTQIQAFTLHATGACEALTGAQQACSEMWISPTWGLRQNEGLRRFDPPTWEDLTHQLERIWWFYGPHGVFLMTKMVVLPSTNGGLDLPKWGFPPGGIEPNKVEIYNDQ